MCGNNCDCIAHANAVITARNNNLSVAVNEGNQQILLKRQIGKAYIRNSRFLSDTELYRLRLGIKEMIQRLNVTALSRTLRADIGNYRFRGDISWINHAAEVQVIKHGLEGHSVNLGNNFSLRHLAGIESQHHVLLINTRKRHESLRALDSLFL